LAALVQPGPTETKRQRVLNWGLATAIGLRLGTGNTSGSPWCCCWQAPIALLVMLAGTAGVVALRGVIPALEPPDPLLIGVMVFA
jgi:hypothetical protein